MRAVCVIARRASFAIILAVLALLLPGLAQAQVPSIPIVKFPSGPDVTSAGPGQFACPAGGTARWIVVIDNSSGIAPITNATFDDDMSGRPVSCNSGNVCNGVTNLDLICPAAPDPDAPSGPPGSIVNCDAAGDAISITGINVPAGGIGCIRFSTIIDAAAIGTQVGNMGCLTLAGPGGQQIGTRPTTGQPTTCVAGIGTGVAGCSNLFVPSVQPPRFTAVKTATYSDTDGDGVLSVGDRITWTVDMTNDTTDDQTGFVFDDIPDGASFVDITTNPDGACSFDAGEDRIECPDLLFLASGSHQLVFRTDVACTVFADVLDAGGTGVCNQARVCTSAAATTCFQSDDDGALPTNEPTCVAFPAAAFLSSEKTWTFTDDDGDGGVSAGDRITFTLRIENSGDAIGTEVQVIDSLDPGCMDVTTVNAGSGTFNSLNNSITWNIGDLAMGGSRTLTFSVDALGAGPTCCNQAFVTDRARRDCSAPGQPTDDPGTVAASDPTCVRFGPQPLLVVEKDWVLITDNNGNGIPEDTDVIEWVVTVTNTGGAAATDVSIVDSLSVCQQGFAPASVTIIGGGTNNSRAEQPPFDAGTVQVDDAGGPTGIAAGGGSVEVRFRTTLRNISPCCNRATVTYAESGSAVESDDPMTGGAADITCTVRSAGGALLSVSKTASDADADGCFEPGEVITFTIDVGVSGAAAPSLRLVDRITDPGNVLTVMDLGGGTFDLPTNSVVWTPGDVADGYAETFTWTARIQCDAADTTAFSDTATLSSPGSTNGSDTVNSTVAAPVLTVSKGSNPQDPNFNGVFDPGEFDRFSINITNTGSCASGAVSVSDQLDVDLDWATVGFLPPGSGIDGGVGNLTWNSTTTPALASLAPGASVSVVVQARALDPATNPSPMSDGVVDNSATAQAAGAFGCPGPQGTGSLAPGDTIGAVGPRLEVTKSQSDADGDGCVEPGEVVTYTINVTARSGPAAGVLLTDIISDPNSVLTNINPGLGTYDALSNTITWDLGAIPQDATQTRTWSATVDCAAADGVTVNDRAGALGVGVAPGSASLTTTIATAILAVDKTAAFNDANVNGVLDPGETVTFTLGVKNTGSCASSSNVNVTDVIDTDLDSATISSPDGPQIVGSTVTWTPLTTPTLGSIAPGATVSLTVTATALDPATNPGGDSLVNNRADATAAASNGCPAPAATDSLDAGAGEVYQIGGAPGGHDILRNDAISCRLTAFAAMVSLDVLQTRGGNSECSTVPAIQATQSETDVIPAAATGSHTFNGDAAPGTDSCPQIGAGPGRVLIFYEITDTSCAAAITTVRLTKSGADVVMVW